MRKTFSSLLYLPIAITFLIVSFPIALLILLIAFIFRISLVKFAPFLRKDHGNALNAQGCVLNQEGLTVVTTFYVEGNLCLEVMKDCFFEKVVLAKDARGVLKYPELQQYIDSWYGIYFWKWDTGFKIDNHICVYDASQHNTHEVLVKHLETSPFPNCRSPWNIFLLKNCKGIKFPGRTEDFVTSTVIFRFHHAMLDGFALFTLLYKEMAGTTLQPFVVPVPKYNLFIRCVLLSSLVFSRCLSYFTDPNYFFDTNGWHSRNLNNSVTYKSEFQLLTSDFIPVEKIKTICQKYSVCRSTVIFSAITGAIRKIMLQKGVNVPNSIRLWQAFPKEAHPGKLTNHFDLDEITLPVGINDPFDRLEYIKNKVDRSKNQIFQLGARLMCNISSLMPKFIFKKLQANIFHTVTYSRWASPSKLTLFGHNVIYWDFVVGKVDGNTPIYIYCNSYEGYLRFSIQIHRDLTTENDINAMLYFLLDELNVLEYNNLDIIITH